MIEKIVKIIDKEGMRVRRWHLISHTAESYKSNIFIEYKDNENRCNTINMKSIIEMTSLPAGYGVEFKIVINGKDENEAAETIVRLFEMEFEEICGIYYNMFQKEKSEKEKFEKLPVMQFFGLQNC